jgi:hypothetical protein
MWLATFIHHITIDSTSYPVHIILCCSEDIDKCIEYIKGYTYSQELEEWKSNFVKDINDPNSNTVRHIKDMRNKISYGINISFNGNKTHVEFEYIKFIN